MKTKLTLSIDDKAVYKLKRKARQHGKSLSAFMQDSANGVNDERKKAWDGLKKILRKSKRTKSVSEKTLKQQRIKHLLKKHG